MQEKDIAAEFLELFIKRLIYLSTPTDLELKPKISRPVEKIPTVIVPSPRPTPKPREKFHQSPIIRPQPRRPLPQRQPPIVSRPETNPFLNMPAMKKLKFLLQDPRVQSVECPGPDKNVIVNYHGRIQTSPVSLTKQEIDEIMKEFSEKTRIPLASGVFKTRFGGLLVTAVVSDYVGTRFLVQKRGNIKSF